MQAVFPQEIIGVIRDAGNGQGVPFAVIYLPEYALQTTSDDSGFFSIKSDELIKNEKIDLRISRIGYETSELEIARNQFLNPLIIRISSLTIPSQSILIKAFNTASLRNSIIFSGLEADAINKTHFVQDIPEMLNTIPSAFYYSEGGNGIGYNYLSIRGFDQRRIAVLINGIPQNDPEDHNVYWVDIADLMGSTDLIEVQRGAGGGLYGSPAIGGAINIVTRQYSINPEFKLSSTAGSYNTRKYSAEASSGLIEGKYSVYSKLARIISSGYRENSWADLSSYHLSVTRFDKDFTTQLNLYGGPIADGLVYTGLPKFAVKDKELRKKNYSFWMQDGNSYTYTVSRRPEEIENFSQPHYEMLNEWKLSRDLKLNSALFYTVGKGFFDYDGSWGNYSYFRIRPEYGFSVNGDPDTLYMPNVLIRATVENNQFGWLPKLLLKHRDGELIVGAELRKHKSFKWGIINFANEIPAGVDGNHRYHEFRSEKDMAGLYITEIYKYDERIEASGELHLSYNSYRIYEEKYAGNDFTIKHLFLNPRFSVSYKYDPENLFYFAAGRVSREPRLRNYYDAAEASGGATPQFALNSNGTYNFTEPLVKPEKMTSIDAGYSYNADFLKLNLNTFFMSFRDEIVKLGQIDKLGVPATGNAENTVHYGVELSGSVKFLDGFQLIANAALSKNYFQSGKTFLPYNIETIDTIITIDLKENPIAGFPSVVINSVLNYTSEKVFLQLSAKYVGSFYSDNYGQGLEELSQKFPGIIAYPDNRNDAYIATDLLVSYSANLFSVHSPSKVYLKINNVIDSFYSMNAIGGEFFPAAERNVLFGVEIGLF